MTEKDRLLRIRSNNNKRRPKFKRENYYQFKRIQTSWRKPKGIDSKMRHQLKGKRQLPQTGYRNPSSVRGLHPSGKEVIRIETIADLEKIDPNTQIVQIGGTVGSRKRVKIINAAEDMDIHIINPQIRRIEFEEEDLALEEPIEELDVENLEDLELIDDEEESNDKDSKGEDEEK